MAWATLIIGAGLFLIGVLGQTFGSPKRRESQADEKRAGLFALRIAAILIGAWLLIIAISSLIRAHPFHSRQRLPGVTSSLHLPAADREG